MINIIKQGLQVQGAIVEANQKVVNLSDRKAKQLKAKGKRIVHKPAELELFNSDKPEPPKAA